MYVSEVRCDVMDSWYIYERQATRSTDVIDRP
jgi:hypothetical protein